MSSFALRVPTAHAGLQIQPNGHCFIVLPAHETTLRDLISRKVRAEWHKLVGTGAFASSLLDLTGPLDRVETMDVAVVVQHALAAWERGAFLVLLGMQPLVDLDAPLTVTRESRILFVVVPPEPIQVIALRPEQLRAA
ncbi:MAG TPA: hypothetical protein VFZ66_29735 [Herpetosiphonaceae bacterium]